MNPVIDFKLMLVTSQPTLASSGTNSTMIKDANSINYIFINLPQNLMLNMQLEFRSRNCNSWPRNSAQNVRKPETNQNGVKNRYYIAELKFTFNYSVKCLQYYSRTQFLYVYISKMLFWCIQNKKRPKLPGPKVMVVETTPFQNESTVLDVTNKLYKMSYTALRC